jgi:hypothetical protein
MPKVPSQSRSTLRPNAVTAYVIALGVLIGFAGCEQVAKRFTRETLPNYGAPLPVSARMVVDPSVTNASASYIDSCGHPEEMRLGASFQDALLEGAYQTFETVQDGPGSSPQPDVEARIRLLKPTLTINGEAMYDRAPTELRLDGMVEFRDAAGKLLAEKELHVVRKDRLAIEPSQKRCAYVTYPFIEDAAVALTAQFMREARSLLDPSGQYAGPPRGTSDRTAPKLQQTSITPPSPTVTPSPLTFKATLFDENANGVIEAGERVRIRVDVANAGDRQTRDATVRIAGTAGIVAQFPSPTLPVGLLQPGESRSIEFVATIPQSVQPHQAELAVTLSDPSGGMQPPGQVLTAQVKGSPQLEGGQRSKRSRQVR